jgi:hypothetical protein
MALPPRCENHFEACRALSERVGLCLSACRALSDGIQALSERAQTFVRGRRALSEARRPIVWPEGRIRALPKSIAATRPVHWDRPEPAVALRKSRRAGRPAEQTRHRATCEARIAVRAWRQARRSDRALPAGARARPIAGALRSGDPEAPHHRPALKLVGAPAIKSSSRSGRLESAADGAKDAARPERHALAVLRAGVRLYFVLSALRLAAARPPVLLERERS